MLPVRRRTVLAAWVVVALLVGGAAAASWPQSVDRAGFVSGSVPDSAGR